MVSLLSGENDMAQPTGFLANRSRTTARYAQRLPSGTRIWLVAGVTDMRKSFNGLGELVQHVLDDNPFSGHLFIFRGRKGDTVRILWADADGLCLFTKRLEEGQFVWPAVRDGKIAITRSQLAILLDKLDWRKPKTARLNSLTML